MARNLMNYLPPYIKDVKEIKCIMNAEQNLISKLDKEIDNILNDAFVEDATEQGVGRWEAIFKVTSKADELLDDRKFRLLTRMNEQLPYTFKGLQQQLDTLCGVGQYDISLDGDNYLIAIKIELTAKSMFDSVSDLLIKMLPANMQLELTLRYNQYGQLEKYTHESLMSSIHENLREEVLT